MHIRLTDKTVRELSLPARGTVRAWDIPDARNPKNKFVRGFGVRLSAGGTKSFVLHYRRKPDGRERLYTIGPFGDGDYSTEAARDEAEELRARIMKGDDPQGKRHDDRDAPDMAKLCDRFLAEYVPSKRPTTQREYRSLIETYVRPALGRKLVVTVDHDDIVRLHGKITEQSPYQANRATAVLSKMFTLAITRWRMRADNPASRIEKNPEQKRKRYLTPDELKRLTDALARHENQDVANVFRLLLLTGARREEVVSARFEQFDLDHRKVWTKPASSTKQRRDHEVPLGDQALALLKAMRKAAPDAEFLFPGGSTAGHRTQINRHWNRICERAGIPRSGPQALRIHDCRHSYASMLVSAGFSLPVIGNLLGHTQPTTTARYSHLFTDVTRAATNKVGSQLAGLIAKPSKRKPLKVVSGGKR
jgi:integrase